jgi:cell division protein FtsL
MARSMTAAVTAPARRAPLAPPTRAPLRRPVEAPKREHALPVPRGAAVLDALLRGRAWIGLVFVLLVGIVFLNVNLLRMNRQIAAASARSDAVKVQNARLRTDLARLGSSERVQRVAAERGLVLPAPGEVRYLKSAPRADAARAAARLKSADGEASPQTASQPQPTAGAQPQPTAGAQVQPATQPQTAAQAPATGQPGGGPQPGATVQPQG